MFKKKKDIAITKRVMLALKMAELATQKMYGVDARLLQANIVLKPYSAQAVINLEITSLVLVGEDNIQKHTFSCFINVCVDHQPSPCYVLVQINGVKEEFRYQQFQYCSKLFHADDIHIAE